MARSATSASARLRALERAKGKARGLSRNATLTARPMADLLGVSWTTLRDWCVELPGFAESGAFDQGSEGIEWVFRPLKVIGFLEKHFRAEQKRSVERSRRVRRIVAGDTLDGVPDEYDLDDLRKLISLSATVQDQREKQGQLTDAAAAATAFRVYHEALQEAALRAAQEQDPNGFWSPEMRESFENAMRSVLLKMQKAGQKCLAALNGNAA